MKVLITGANGFLGSWLCRSVLELPEVTAIAAVRSGADLTKITHLEGLSIREIDYSTEQSVKAFCESVSQAWGSIDLVIHNAGITKSTSRDMNFKVNEGITQKLLVAIKETQLQVGKFVYVSSQAAKGPVGEGKAVSAYGQSKYAAEKAVLRSGLPYVIFRPTGIYGPGDAEFLSLFKAVNMGFYPCAAPKKQRVTLIHVSDVAKNIVYHAQELTRSIVHLDDGAVYSHAQMKEAMEKALMKKALMIYIPKPLVTVFLNGLFFLSRLFHFEPILTPEKYNEISKDWDHDFSLERKEIPLTIQYGIYAGFENTAQYYKSEGLL